VWAVVPGPPAPGGDGQLDAVACAGIGDCWAVGSDGGSPAESVTDGTALIEQGTSTGWSIVAGPAPSPSPVNGSSALSAVTCVAAADCWAVGYSADANLNDSTLIEHYAGGGWTVVASPTPAGGGELTGIGCASADDCWAVGYSTDASFNQQPLIEQYTGSGWTIVSGPQPTGTSGQLAAVTCVSAADCWAVGYTGVTGGTPLTLIENYADGGWRIVPSPKGSGSDEPSSLESVTCAGATDCWAAGSDNAGDTWNALLEEYSGTGWNIVSNPPLSTSTESWLEALAAVTCAGEGTCWAAGALESGLAGSGSADEYTLIEEYAGGAWTVVSSPNPPAATGVALAGIACATASDCWAVGSYDDDEGNPQPLIEQALSPAP
jgi:hypothetical protein